MTAWCVGGRAAPPRGGGRVRGTPPFTPSRTGVNYFPKTDPRPDPRPGTGVLGFFFGCFFWGEGGLGGGNFIFPASVGDCRYKKKKEKGFGSLSPAGVFCSFDNRLYIDIPFPCTILNRKIKKE